MTLSRLSLAQFRSWPRLALDLDDRPLALFGPNGAGKTNILEALSMLLPGRGLRGAVPVAQARQGVEAGWRIRELDAPYAPRVGRSKVTGTIRGTRRAIQDMSRLLREAGR